MDRADKDYLFLQVQELVRMGSSFHNFGAATLIGLSLNPEKDLPLKNTSKHATGSIELKLNLVARQGH